MSVVCRLIDGPVAPLALHMGAGFTSAPEELLFMEVPGRTDGPLRWVRMEPEFAALEDPDARFEWYDLDDPAPYVELAGNALYAYHHREGFKTVVVPRRFAGEEETLSERLRTLHASARSAALEHELGEPLQETMTLVCDRCRTAHKLNFDRFGIDWPDQLAGWGKGPEGDICPECVARG